MATCFSGCSLLFPGRFFLKTNNLGVVVGGFLGVVCLLLYFFWWGLKKHVPCFLVVFGTFEVFVV